METLFEDEKKACSLNIVITEDQSEVINLQLPARSVLDLDNLIPEGARTKMASSGHSVSEIVAHLNEENLYPQILFEGAVEKRIYRIWLD